MDDTLWKNPEKKFKPRNKQAALICIKAKPIFQPPEEIPAPVMAETFAEKLAKENAERAKRVADLKAENARKEKETKAREAIIRERQRILKVIRTTVSECEKKGRPIPQSVEELREKLNDFPKDGKRK